MCVPGGGLSAESQAEEARLEYEIGLEDVLVVSVLGHPELSGEASVDEDGMLAVPVLGEVRAAGLSTRSLERKLTTLLSDGYLKKPQVEVSVKEYRSQKVFVSGEVLKPGPHPLRGERSLRELLLAAGIAPDAGHEILVMRPSSDPPPPGLAPPGGLLEPIPGLAPGADVFRVGRRALLTGRPEFDLVLRAEDTVYVPRAAQVFVTGQVARPGALRFEEGTTVHQALLASGGISERGSEGKLKIMRLVEGRRVETKAALTDLLLPGDTVVVGERLF